MARPSAGGAADLAPARAPKTLAPLRGSRTAEVVAATRARHLLRHPPPWIIEDRFAIHFAGRRWRRILDSDVLDWLYLRLVRRLIPVSMQQLTRARFAEDRIGAAAGRGVSQLVILGAGFDTFALRRPELPLTVFEVDLAATQALKRERMASAGIETTPQLRFVTVDFERDDLGRRLAAAGFDHGKPAFFNWMGVTYYLTGDAIRGTLARLTELAAPGSELTLDYLIAEKRLAPGDRAVFRQVQRWVTRRGEPLVSAFEPEFTPREMGIESGWELLEQSSPADQSARYLAGRSDLPPLTALFACLHLRRR